VPEIAEPLTNLLVLRDEDANMLARTVTNFITRLNNSKSLVLITASLLPTIEDMKAASASSPIANPILVELVYQRFFAQLGLMPPAYSFGRKSFGHKNKLLALNAPVINFKNPFARKF
jgi:hypothetical protein